MYPFGKVVTLIVIVMSPRPFSSQDLTTQGTNARQEGLSLVANVFMVDNVDTLSTLCTLNNPLKESQTFCFKNFYHESR